ncbi:unnamed protein product [Candidula unifasciata]|uniref:Uncharacterized protein n=1 Tax=Candidula unifasciata TaxID=100452 RepID=A0A8S3YI90_9EUPU|nr:unnamed protein product [Candidula unifasciata]
MDRAENQKRELPIDRGWSWVICLASFVCMFIMGTSMQAVSVLFLELVVEFRSSVTITSLTVMCFIMALSVSSVISTSVLIPIFGERPVVIVSGFVFAVFSVGYFLAPNIIVFIAFAAGKGTCMGMVFVPCVSLLSCYFNKRRSLATTICNSGVCVATIVAPPIIRALTAEFGMRGTFLILGAVELHMIAAGLLMRPVSSYRSAPKENPGISTTAKPEVAVASETSHMRTASITSETGKIMEEGSHILATSLPDEHNLSENVQYDKPFNDFSNNGHIGKSKTRTVSVNELGNGDTRELMEIEGLLAEEKLHSQIHRKGSISKKGSLSQRSVRGSRWSFRHTPVGSLLSLPSGVEPVLTSGVLQVSPPAEVKSQGWKSCCCIVIIRRIFDPYLFSQWSYRWLLISCVPSATTQFLFQYIPTIAVIKGASKDQAATLVTIIGSVDLVSRLATGVFADTHLLKATQIVAISQICQGILCQFNSLFDSFEKMIAMVVVMGLFIGTRQSLMAMTHIEIVGMSKMSRCLSISAMVATVSAASHSPMLSAIMEATGSYNIVLHYVGVALIVGALLMLVASFLDQRDKKQEAKKATAHTK